jgi:hypothetical protein
VANLALQYDLIGNVTAKTSATDAQEHVGSFDYQTPQAGCSYCGHSQRHAVRNAGRSRRWRAGGTECRHYLAAIIDQQGSVLAKPGQVRRRSRQYPGRRE